MNSDFKQSGLLEALKKLAEADDAGCLNAYGVYIAVYGTDNNQKLEGVEMLRKAITGGSGWARYNIIWACDWNIKQGPDFEKEKQTLLNYVDTLSPQAAYNFASVLFPLGIQDAIRPWFFEFMYDVIKKICSSRLQTCC